ncbi:unnamed protein product [Lepeophtheirus salmonis]|uniref:(salmon louse) hypothetical protein n=1 Tax=Lepeophtheirus salmonis TaxID=72036 RepID=A0A7R8HB30_LEPSM|nr:unnamed protein product [Lepeophtheirus salmonis]CAF2979978.1 unnamed protein product [Lepeophtheirus salmonis]
MRVVLLFKDRQTLAHDIYHSPFPTPYGPRGGIHRLTQLVPNEGQRRLEDDESNNAIYVDNLTPEFHRYRGRRRRVFYRNPLSRLFPLFRRQRKRRRNFRSNFRYRRHKGAIKARGRAYESDEMTAGGMLNSIGGSSSSCNIAGDSREHRCTFTPACWIAGGSSFSGCSSVFYSCCILPEDPFRKDQFNNRKMRQLRLETSRKIRLQNDPQCGLTKHNSFSKRIIGGKKAKFAELPWQVHIRISGYQCGGVLLNHLHVATAAHCVHRNKLDQITVRLGEFDTKNTDKIDEPLDSESFKVTKIRLHPEFRYMLTQPDRYDIAILELDRPVVYKDNILPICLPTSDFSLTGKTGVVAGWGKTDNSFGKTGTHLLHKVLVPIIENEQCKHWHREKSIAVQLHDEMFCAGHEEGQMDACLGDSGGPLVINFDGRWTLIGITSAGFGCAVEKQPGIYHKVSKTAEWLADHIHEVRK